MKKNVFIISLFFISLIYSCTFSEKSSLTDEKVKNYIEVYKQLREEAPIILEKINSNPKNADIGQEQYATIQNIIKDGGFDNYAQFVMVNAKIGSIFSIIQANSGMEKFENLVESGDDLIDDGIALIKEQLDDPEVPEETKVELRKTLKELQKGQNESNDNWKKNEKIAKIVMKTTKKISGLIVSEGDIQIVKKYEAEIMEAYVGFQMPELPDGNFPKLNLDEYK